MSLLPYFYIYLVSALVIALATFYCDDDEALAYRLKIAVLFGLGYPLILLYGLFHVLWHETGFNLQISSLLKKPL